MAAVPGHVTWRSFLNTLQQKCRWCKSLFMWLLRAAASSSRSPWLIIIWIPLSSSANGDLETSWKFSTWLFFRCVPPPLRVCWMTGCRHYWSQASILLLLLLLLLFLTACVAASCRSEDKIWGIFPEFKKSNTDKLWLSDCRLSSLFSSFSSAGD